VTRQELPPEAYELIVKLMQVSYNDYAATTQQLIQGLQYENELLRAELNLIRGNIARLTEAPYAPNPGYVYKLLWPSKEEIKDIVDLDKARSD